jgi:hypothetical protein
VVEAEVALCTAVRVGRVLLLALVLRDEAVVRLLIVFLVVVLVSSLILRGE